MRSINLHQVRGNIGSIDVRTTKGGIAVLNLNVATNETWNVTDQDGVVTTKENTTWHRAVAFGKFAENLTKVCQIGDYVFLSGPFSRQQYADKKTGVMKEASEIRIAGPGADFQFISRSAKKNDQPQAQPVVEESF